MVDSLKSGGSTLQIQYNNAGNLNGMSGTLWNDATQQLSITSTFAAPNGIPTLGLTKADGASSVLDITGGFSGKYLRVMTPPDVAQKDPVTYIGNGGSVETRAWMTISGTTNGLHGDGYLISPPTADPFMLGVFADVPKGIIVRGAGGNDSGPSGCAALTIVNSGGFYTAAHWYDGTIQWGSITNATFAGLDTSLSRKAAASLQMGFESGTPVDQTFGAASVPAPISTSQGFLYGTVLHFAAGVPAGVVNGQVVTDITNPSFVANTVVTNVNAGAKTVTVDKYCNPYAGDTIQFNGTNDSILTDQLGSTRIGYGTLPVGLAVGQAVTDSTHGAAIPGGTTIASFDTSNPPGSGGNIFVVLSAAIDGTLFNTPGNSHDTVVYSTPNTAAKDLIIRGPSGTGTGNGGKVRISVAPAGGAGSNQNASTDYLAADPIAQAVTLGVPLTTKGYTVATLPAAGTVGRRAHVTDQNGAPTFLGALTGGGAIKCPVFDNGVAWVAG